MAVRIANKTMTNDNRKQDYGDEDDTTCTDDHQIPRFEYYINSGSPVFALDTRKI